MRVMRRVAAVGLSVCVALGLSACSRDSGATPDQAAFANQPLEALPDCTEPPDPAVEPPEGFVAPEGAIIQQVSPQDPLISVTGYIAKTPVGVLVEYQSMKGIEVLSAEDEVFESELLVSNGEHRTYVKVTAACRTGSYLLAVVAPEAAAGVLPTPAGTPGAVPVPGAPAATPTTPGMP